MPTAFFAQTGILSPLGSRGSRIEIIFGCTAQNETLAPLGIKRGEIRKIVEGEPLKRVTLLH